MPDVAGPPRWSRGGYAQPYPWPQCCYCGRAQSHDCPPVACAACGSVQCHGNGSLDGTCAVCYAGYLPGWSRSIEARQCGYKGCLAEAVARAPRVRYVCRDHLDRARLGEKIRAKIAHRDAGKGWERWRLVP